MPIRYLCRGCRAMIAKPGRCQNCQRADNRERNERRRVSGRATARWQDLRLACFERDGWACRRCGQAGTRHTLTAHLRPELRGNHWIATLTDVVTLCRSCHGATDAPRAHGNRGGVVTGRTAVESSPPSLAKNTAPQKTGWSARKSWP